MIRVVLASLPWALSAGFAITAVLFPSPSLATRIDSILSSRNLDELDRAVRVSANDKVQRRACEIQRREGLAPTACYGVVIGSSGLDTEERLRQVRELDRECLRSASSARQLAAVDPFTSEVCRDAVAARNLDLAYAGRRDASRYP